MDDDRKRKPLLKRWEAWLEECLVPANGRLALLVAGICAAFAFGYLNLGSDWWFEDDPVQWGFVKEVWEPHRFFAEPGLLRSFGAGNALTPMFLLSIWVDAQIAPHHPLVSYLHHILSFCFASALLALFVSRLTGSRALALVITVLWLFLPSTQAVMEFLSTRHYVEGLIFALMAGLIALDMAEEEDESPARCALVILAAAASILYKEFYVPTVLGGLGLFAWHRRLWRVLYLVVGLTIGYFAYRTWMLGLSLEYSGIDYPAPAMVLRLLRRLPYLAVGSHGGNLLLLAVAIALAWERRGLTLPWRQLGFLFALFAVALVVLFPVSRILATQYDQHGTWYRVIFVPNTLLVGIFAMLLGRLERSRGLLIVGAFVVVMFGSWHSRVAWDELKEDYEREGRAYLALPNKLIYTELPAPWFLVGIHELYDQRTRHFVSYQTRGTERLSHLMQFGTIWRWRWDKYVPDRQLYRLLLAEAYVRRLGFYHPWRDDRLARILGVDGDPTVIDPGARLSIALPEQQTESDGFRNLMVPGLDESFVWARSQTACVRFDLPVERGAYLLHLEFMSNPYPDNTLPIELSFEGEAVVHVLETGPGAFEVEIPIKLRSDHDPAVMEVYFPTLETPESEEIARRHERMFFLLSIAWIEPLDLIATPEE